jgi:hypothetical protein
MPYVANGPNTRQQKIATEPRHMIARGVSPMPSQPGVTLEADPSVHSGLPEPTEWIDDLLKEAFDKAKEPPALRLADILHEIVGTLTRYLYFPHPAIATLIACWIAMTYCFQEFRYSGYLAISVKQTRERENATSGTAERILKR